MDNMHFFFSFIGLGLFLSFFLSMMGVKVKMSI